MENLEDLIQFENENTCLDFKAIEYTREKFESFLKDVLSMANAKSEDDRFIVIGVKPKGDGSRDFLGIDNITDESTYQQLINENIEPEIKLNYFVKINENKKFGIFKIYDCQNQSYMLKKDYKNLKKGECFIRKGSHQTRVTRQDLDYYFDRKYNSNFFNGSLDIYFSINEMKKKSAEISIINNLNLPSKKAAKKIQKILDKRDKEKDSIFFNDKIYDQDFIKPFGGTPFEQRSSKTLKNNLEEIEEIYKEDDCYYLFEEKSSKINIEILNLGETYIEDASVEIKIIKNDNYILFTEVYNKPSNGNSFHDIISISQDTAGERINYPKISNLEEEYIIFENIGNIKHNIPKKIFKSPIRIIALKSTNDQKIYFKIKILSKNIRSYFEGELTLSIVE